MTIEVYDKNKKETKYQFYCDCCKKMVLETSFKGNIAAYGLKSDRLHNISYISLKEDDKPNNKMKVYLKNNHQAIELCDNCYNELIGTLKYTVNNFIEGKNNGL